MIRDLFQLVESGTDSQSPLNWIPLNWKKLDLYILIPLRSSQCLMILFYETFASFIICKVFGL